MRCLIVTPEKTVLDIEATFVVLPLYDGEFGVLPNHLPVVARIGAGDIRIHKSPQPMQETNPVCYYLEGGFVEILDNNIVVMSLFAMPTQELDVVIAESQLQKAIDRPFHTQELAKIREEQLYSRRARLRIAKKYQQNSN
ncbi:MAG: F0F1 ATP synthase subunit epsilon [Planctomycetaceae bacterium]|jgi:F-type H+-transporting ATPase subunit epsilon|nr:F0F1 ATP synthase subunit epsilon [Planctomycetaceae bacterium]